MRRLDPIRCPKFMCVNGYILFIMGGYWASLRVGNAVAWKKHGQFTVEYIGESYGILRHTTLNDKEFILFIPPRCWLIASNGQFYSDQPRYDGFRAHYTQERLHGMLHEAKAA